MEVNAGALIGGIAVAASLMVFLACFLHSGIGPSCCRFMTGRCLVCWPDPKPAHHRASVLVRLPDSCPMTSPSPVQLPVIIKAQRSLPTLPPPHQQQQQQLPQLTYGAPISSLPIAKSAPNPTRPAPSSLPHHVEVLELLPLQQRRSLDGNNNNNSSPNGGGKAGNNVNDNGSNVMSSDGRKLTSIPHHASRSSPLLLLWPGTAGRRGLSGMQLSLSTIRDCSGAQPIPPDCLYYATAGLGSSDSAEYAVAVANDCADTDAAASGKSAAGTSLRAQIGSAYQPLPRRHPLPSVPPPPPSVQLRPPARSNASSSDCHDWSPPRPTALAHRAVADVSDAAVMWTTKDGDVTILDISDSSAHRDPAPSGHISGDNPATADDRSTSF